MEGLALLQRTVDETKRLVDGTKDDQLGDPTLCTDWTVRDIINHVTGGATMFAISAEQGSVPDEQVGQLMGGDNLGDDFRAAFAAATEKAMAAYAVPGVMEKVVTLPFGEMPAGIALNIAVFDVATHACDLARATGQTVDDEELLTAALELGKTMITSDFRVPGVFEAEQPAPDGCTTADRLLAFAGRKV